MKLFGFGKKKEENENHVTSDIKVLGGGCDKCNQLEQAVLEALKALGYNDEIEHVKDYEKIASYGVMVTPALVVDGQVVTCGRVLKKEELIKIIKDVRER